MNLRTAVRDLLSHFPVADGLFRRLLWSKVHFPEVEMRFLNALPPASIDIALDVGAAHASYAWILHRKANRVFAFEPGKDHGDYLEKVFRGTDIQLIRAAVGERAANVKMYTPGKDAHALHSATLSSNNPVAETEGTIVREVKQIALDDIISQYGLEGRRIDFIKVDIEGYELNAFLGARRILATHTPLVFCEIEKRHNSDYGKVFELFKSLGYTTYAFIENAFVPFDYHQIESVQSPEALKIRLSPNHDAKKNTYINNFVFQHPDSRIKVKV